MVSLAAMAARRLVLRRGFGLLAGLAVTSGAAAPGAVPDGFIPGPRSRFASGSNVSDDGEDARRAASKPLSDKLRADRKASNRRWSAWHTQDMDLVSLGSTSRAWRMSVMKSRLAAQDTWREKLEERVDAIWSEPLDKLSALLRSWVDG